MSRRVLDVGQCSFDHGAIRRLVEGSFDATVVQAHGLDDTLEELRAQQYDLVLVNRKLDADYSDGMEILKTIKADPALAAVPVMLVTNYPEHQHLAVASGGEPGFGKNGISKPETRELLAKFLS